MCCICDDSDDPDVEACVNKCGCFVDLACALPRFLARRLRPDDGEGAVARHGQLVAQEMETTPPVQPRTAAQGVFVAENEYSEDGGGNVSESAVEPEDIAATPVIYPPTEPVRMCTWVQPSSRVPSLQPSSKEKEEKKKKKKVGRGIPYGS